MSYKDARPKSKDGRANFAKSAASFNQSKEKAKAKQKSVEKYQTKPMSATYDSENPYTISKGRPKSGKSGKDVFDIVSQAPNATHSKQPSAEDLVDNVKFASVVDHGKASLEEPEPTQDFIQQMEAKAKKHSDNEKYHQAFEIIVKVIDYKQKSLTQHPEEIIEYAIKMCKVFNQFGMALLNTQKYGESQKLFDRIIKSLKKFHGDKVDQLIGLTLNNLSCSYKRNGQIIEAQEALTKAFKYQSKKRTRSRSDESKRATPVLDQPLEDTFGVAGQSQQNKKDELALTELNMCAILSHKGDHQGALKHVRSSIEKLENDLGQLKGKIESGNADQDLVEEAKEKQSLLAIAYYNQGCQQEHLKAFGRSLQSYQVALNLEKSKHKIHLKGETGPQSPTRPSPILLEFTKSYNEMRKKVAAQQAHSAGLSQAALSQGKRTFSNLTKQRVDEHSSAVSGRPSPPRGQLGVRRNQVKQMTSNSNVASRLSPRKDLSQQRKGSSSGENLRRRRPMSAKNPDLVPKFNARNEQSTPQLIGDDIINIQHHVINEEEPIEDAGDNEGLNKRPQTLQTAKVEQPRSKARRIRPVSSYVKNLGGEQRHSGLLGQPQLPQKKKALQDQMFLGGTTSYNYSSKQNQMLNEPSDRFSNLDSLSNVGIKKPSKLASALSGQPYCKRRLAQQRRPAPTLKAESKVPIVVSHNMVNFNPITQINNAETIDQDGNPYISATSSFQDYQLRQRPQSSKIRQKFSYQLKTAAQSMTKRQRVLKYKVPKIPKPKRQLLESDQPYFTNASSRPTQKQSSFQQLMTLNHDLESQLNINEGENLIEAIDRNYRAMRPAGRSQASIAVNNDDPYTREMNKQAKYTDDNKRLEKDLKSFNIKLSNADRRPFDPKQGLWKKQRPSTANIRPSTAKTKYSGQQQQVNTVSQPTRSNFQDIEQNTFDRELEIVEHGNETTFRNSGGADSEAQRQSRLRPRSMKKQIKEKDKQSSKVRPRSAYVLPQQNHLAPGSAAELNKNLRSITNPTGRIARDQLVTKQQLQSNKSQPQITAQPSRVQSAGARRLPGRPVSGNKQDPYSQKEDQKRIRPQNRPTRFLGEASGSALMEIDEFSGANSNSDTQIIYSGNHSQGGSAHKSSVGRSLSRKEMATIQEAKNALENTENFNQQTQDDMNKSYGVDKKVSILNDSFNQNMNIVNEESKDTYLVDQLDNIASNLKGGDLRKVSQKQALKIKGNKSVSVKQNSRQPSTTSQKKAVQFVSKKGAKSRVVSKTTQITQEPQLVEVKKNGPNLLNKRPDPEEVKKDKANERIEQFYTQNQRDALAKQRVSIERTIQLSQTRSREGSPTISQRGKLGGSSTKQSPKGGFDQLQLKVEIRAPVQASTVPQMTKTLPTKQDSYTNENKTNSRRSSRENLKGVESQRNKSISKSMEKSGGIKIPQTQKPQVAKKLHTQAQKAQSSNQQQIKTSKEKPVKIKESSRSKDESKRPVPQVKQSVRSKTSKEGGPQRQERQGQAVLEKQKQNIQITKTNQDEQRRDEEQLTQIVQQYNQTNIVVPTTQAAKEQQMKVVEQNKEAKVVHQQQDHSFMVASMIDIEPNGSDGGKDFQQIKPNEYNKDTPELKQQDTRIDPNRPLADQLEIESLGTSGYKTGESEFDEEYYQDYQEYQRHIEQKKKEWVNQVRAEKLDAIFQRSYKQFEKLKITYDLKNKLYNPYNIVKEEKKKIKEKERMVEVLKEAKLQEMHQNIKKMQQEILVQIEMQYNQPKVKEQARATLLENEEKSNQYDQLLVPEKIGEDDEREVFMQQVLTGQIKNLLLPIRADNYDNDLDRDRAAAFQRFKHYPRLQIDQGPYLSEKLGLCQLVFVLHRKAHVLQILLYEADDDLKAMSTKLRVNREMSLSQLGIPKPVATSLSVKDEQQTTTVEEYFESQHRETCMNIIQAVRSFKKKFTGDMYTDFYALGEPSQEDYQTKNWHNFTLNLMLKEKLVELVNEKKVEQIQQKYFQSEAFLNMQSKLDTVDWQFAAEKTDMQRLRFAQSVLRKRLRYKSNMTDEGFRQKRQEKDQGFYLSRSSLQKLAFTKILQDGRKYQQRIHTVFEVKISEDNKQMIIQGRDLNRRTGQNHTIAPLQLQTTSQFVEMAGLDWDFFFSQISVSPQTQMSRTLTINPGLIHYDFHMQYRLELEEFQQTKKLNMIKTETPTGMQLIQITERQEVLMTETNFQRFNSFIYQKSPTKLPSEKQSPDYRALYNTKPQTSMSIRQFTDRSEVLSPKRVEPHQKYKAIKQYQTLNYGGNASKVRPKWSENDKFTTIFDNRKQMALRKEYFQAFNKVQRDEDMKKHQKWWRKQKFRMMVQYVLIAATQQKKGTVGELEDSNETKIVSIDQKQKVLESEANMRKIGAISQELELMAYRKNWDFVKTIQRVFRMRMLIKRTKRRFLEAINSGQTVLHQCVAEFYENPKERQPYNYMIMINKGETNKALPVFNITMLLNNAPEKQRQSINLTHDLNEDTMGGRYEQILIENSPNVRFYFQHLIFERLKFRPYTEGKKQELQRQTQLSMFDELEKMHQDEFMGKFSNKMGSHQSQLPDGDYVIMPFLESTISKAKMREIDLNIIAVDEHGQFMGSESEMSDQ